MRVVATLPSRRQRPINSKMARSFQHVTPDRLRIREGGGCIAVFGLPFFIAGVFLILTTLGVVPVGNADKMPAFAWPAMILMGVAFTAVGGTLVFGRSWTTIDSTQRTVIKQWGLLVPLRERTFPLGEYTAVTLGFVEGDSDTSDRFPVGLKARAGADLALCSFTAYAESRECAVIVAKHVHLDLEDASTDHPTRLPYSEADRAFQHRMSRERVPQETAIRPADARSEVTLEAGSVRIVIPRSRMHPIALAAGLIPVAIPLVVAPPLAEFFRRTHTPGPVAWIFLAFIVFFFGILPVMTLVNAFLRSRRGGTIVVVSPQGIRIQERGAWRTRTVASLDAADILDVDYSTRESTIASARRAAEQKVLESNRSVPAAVGPRTERLVAALARFAKGRGLTVKTRQGLTTFGQGLADDELRYLYSVVRQGLDG